MLFANCIRWFSYSVFIFSLCACAVVYLFILQRVVKSPVRLPPTSGHVVVNQPRQLAPFGLGGNGHMFEYNFWDTNHRPDANGHVNPHPFRYILTPQASTCRSNEDIYLFVYVHSAPKHRKRRDLIRRTWANVTHYAASVAAIRCVFVIGLPMLSADRSKSVIDDDLQETVIRESLVHRDIIQENYVDCYRNLTYKAVAAMRWITENCFRQSNGSSVTQYGPR